jgi:hypothetical protein
MTQIDLETVSLSIKNHLSKIGYTCDYAWRYKGERVRDRYAFCGPLTYMERDYRVLKIGNRRVNNQKDYKVFIRFVNNGISVTKAHVGRVLDYEMAPYRNGNGLIEYCNPDMISMLKEACHTHIGEIEPEYSMWEEIYECFGNWSYVWVVFLLTAIISVVCLPFL